jgi:hypothetical protein
MVNHCPIGRELGLGLSEGEGGMRHIWSFLICEIKNRNADRISKSVISKSLQ